jgi:hypothetical protein
MDKDFSVSHYDYTDFQVKMAHTKVEARKIDGRQTGRLSMHERPAGKIKTRSYSGSPHSAED